MKNRSMLTKLITVASAAACFALAGCGAENDTAAVKNEAAGSDKETVETEGSAPTPEATATPTPEPTATPTPTPEPEPVTWFDEQGLTVTPQGEFNFRTQWNHWLDGYPESSRHKAGDEVEITANASVTETTEGVESGYKKLVGTFEYDWAKFFYSYTPIVSYDPGLGSIKPSVWISAFDRYTGTSFEPGDVVIPIEYNGTTYDVKAAFNWDADYDYDIGKMLVTGTITITCPADYDGAVFEIGCGTKYDPEKKANDDEPYNSIDYSKPVMEDEFPFFTDKDHPHIYFSITNK